MSKERTPVEYFTDAFGEETRVGDRVVYVIGDKTSKQLVKGTVQEIYTTKYYSRDEMHIKIECTEDNSRFRNPVPRISPLQHGQRIMNLETLM